MQILSEIVIRDHGTYRRVRQYLPGHHPQLGLLTSGWSGAETVVERDVIVPVRRIVVAHGADGGNRDDSD